MSVLKRKRNISKMEFYHNAIQLRLLITEFLLRDFGIKSRRRDLNFAKEIYDMDDVVSKENWYWILQIAYGTPTQVQNTATIVPSLYIFECAYL